MKLLLLLFASTVLTQTLSFAATPSATTLAATSLSGTGATLNGTVNANGSSTAVSFEFGLTTAYGSTATATPTPVTGSSPTAVSAVLTGLTPGTVYHFRASGTSTGGTSTGGDLLFATALPNVAAVFNAATSVPVAAEALTATGAPVNFTLNFAPVTGTELMVVKNTGLSFINGTFSNLAQGQTVTLTYSGANYPFVANYYGGTGNDLVLVWKANRALAWGRNIFGQLGNNSTATNLVPTAVSPTGVLAGKTVISMSGGLGHSLALCSDGTVAAWGDNRSGQLGNSGMITSSFVPVVAVSASGGGRTVIAVAAGDEHSLALYSDGTVTAWGSNTYGQVGNTSPQSPTSALFGKTVIAVAAGAFHNLALCSDGTVAAWGRNSYGELGNNSMTSSTLPVAVNTSGVLAGKTVVGISAGFGHSVARCSDGTVAAWGWNFYGQLGYNSAADSLVPVAVDTSGVLAGKTVLAVAAGSVHTLALCSDGTVARWGHGGGVNSEVFVPVAVDTSGVLSGKTVIAVTAGYGQSLARCSDGTVAAWGANNSGQLGNNSTDSSLLPVAVNTTQLAAGERFMLVAGGSSPSHTLAVVAISQTPIVTTLAATSLSRTGATLNGTVNATARSTAVSFNYGTSMAYGSTLAATPTPVTGSNSVSVSANLLGLSPGTVYHYRVSGTSTGGTSTGGDMVFATAMPDLTAVYNAATNVPMTAEAATATGATVNFMLNFAPTTGTELMVVKTTGLGFINGTFSNLAQGQTVTLSYGGTDYPFVANYYGGTGNDLVLVWKAHRPLTWGWNTNGQLGNNSVIPSAVPTAVNTTGVLSGKTILAVAVGGSHNLALCSDGTVAAWGSNSSGQLGNSSTTNSPVPVAVNLSGVLAGKTVIVVAAGGSHSLVLCSDGTLAAWGYNYSGQLGNNSTTSSTVPVAVNTSGVLAGKTVIAVAGGSSHSLALCSDSTVVAWGENSDGQLGNNSTTGSAVPVAVNTSAVLFGKTVIAVAVGTYHSLALCSDGTLAAWGDNLLRQLGNNSTTDSPVPVAVNTTPLAAGERFIRTASGPSGTHSLALVATPPPSPILTTLAATSISSTGATLNSSVNANGSSTAVSFTYGTTVAYGSTATATPTTVTGNSSTVASATLTGLVPGTLYHFRVNGVSGVGPTSGTDLTFTTPIPQPAVQQAWRQTHFSIPGNTGNAADDADPDHDGLPNLIEWACHLDPTASSQQPFTTQRNGATFEFTYTRSVAAMNAGAVFTVEWSDALSNNLWSSSSVTRADPLRQRHRAASESQRAHRQRRPPLRASESDWTMSASQPASRFISLHLSRERTA